mmetsp:Transcript_19810/g.27248  ORF Transcript_19810/g.27248 Transcript_19810/m.27248 type:complete len:84 (-) Transcript_19810:496-747(-)
MEGAGSIEDADRHFLRLAEEVMFRILRYDGIFYQLFGQSLHPGSTSPTALDIDPSQPNRKFCGCTTYSINNSDDESGIFRRLH